MTTNKLTDIANGSTIRNKVNEVIDNSIENISISNTNIVTSKSDGSTSSINVPSNLKLTVTASTQTERLSTVASYNKTHGSYTPAYESTSGSHNSAHDYKYTYYTGITNPGLGAGTYTLQNLLQQLVNRSHTHTVHRHLASADCDCNCNCYYDSCSSSSCLIKGNVLTDKGYIALENLKIGDMIADNNGNYHKLKGIVVGKLENRKAVNFKNSPSVFTSEHLFLINNKYVTYDIEYCKTTLSKIIGDIIKGTYERKLETLTQDINLEVNEEYTKYETKTYTLIVENSELCIVDGIVAACAKKI
jgi:hypothetical protein